MNRDAGACSSERQNDWAGDWRMLVALWGIPAAAMAGATLLEPSVRAFTWVAMLLWMGIACLINARRCSRTHCRVTGPFFLVMAALVIAYAIGALPLGSSGWFLIGGATVVGFALLWWGTEHALGRFSGSRR